MGDAKSPPYMIINCVDSENDFHKTLTNNNIFSQCWRFMDALSALIISHMNETTLFNTFKSFYIDGLVAMEEEMLIILKPSVQQSQSTKIKQLTTPLETKTGII